MLRNLLLGGTFSISTTITIAYSRNMKEFEGEQTRLGFATRKVNFQRKRCRGLDDHNKTSQKREILLYIVSRKVFEFTS